MLFLQSLTRFTVYFFYFFFIFFFFLGGGGGGLLNYNMDVLAW